MKTDEPDTWDAWTYTDDIVATAGGATDTVAKDQRVLILKRDTTGEAGVPFTLDLFGRAKPLRALTLLDDVVERLVTRGRNVATIRRD